MFYYTALKRNHLHASINNYKHKHVKSKEGEKTYHANINPKKAWVAKLIPK